MGDAANSHALPLSYPEVFEQRWNNYNGFLYQYQPELMMDATEEDRLAMFDKLWKMVIRAATVVLIISTVY